MLNEEWKEKDDCEEFAQSPPHRPPPMRKYEGGYLLPEEIPKYCGIIEGVTPADVRTASTLIDGYLGRSYEQRQYSERVKLFRHHRGRLKHHPVLSIDKVVAIGGSIFGKTKEEVEYESIDLDPENDGYFTYQGRGGLNALIYGKLPHLLEITYTSGFAEYPEALKTACGMLACNIRQAMSYAGAKELTSLDFQVLMADDSFFTSDIKMLLKGLE